ncbi:MAG: response regulator transcription factor [Pseudomonadota bacterium]
MDDVAHTDKHMVLLVDDSPETLSLLIEALEAAGLMTLVARSGDAALKILVQVKPDLILLDAMMPGMDGFDVCQTIKEQSEFALIPIIFMTGLDDSEHVVRGLRAGGVDYVTKPIKPDELIARVSIHVANARMIRDARQALDGSGQSLIAFRTDLSIAWASARATELLGTDLNALCPKASSLLEGWIDEVSHQPLSKSQPLDVERQDGSSVRLSSLGRSGSGDILARASLNRKEPPGQILSQKLPLSAREGEVLAWLANGKSNKDIATILDLSPRTITKHVEQIFTKLGVENRTAAAAIAFSHLSA